MYLELKRYEEIIEYIRGQKLLFSCSLIADRDTRVKAAHNLFIKCRNKIGFSNDDIARALMQYIGCNGNNTMNDIMFGFGFDRTLSNQEYHKEHDILYGPEERI